MHWLMLTWLENVYFRYSLFLMNFFRLLNKHKLYENKFFQEVSISSIKSLCNNCLFWCTEALSLNLSIFFPFKKSFNRIFTKSFPTSVAINFCFIFDIVIIFPSESLLDCDFFLNATVHQILLNCSNTTIFD